MTPCANCGHSASDHVRMIKSKTGPGYREVRGKKRYGACSYMHGIPGNFCTCPQFVSDFTPDNSTPTEKP